MVEIVKLANLKGPKGNGFANPKIVGDNLVVDEMDGTEVSRPGVVVGNVRGNKGDKGPMPTLVVTAEPGGDELQPVAQVSETPTGYRLALKNTKGRTPLITASAETSPAGSTAQVWATPTDAGTNLAFTIPRGDKGDTGPVGPMPDLAFRTLANDPSLETEVSVERMTDGTGYTVTLNHVKGPVGPVGPAPRLEMEQPVNLPAGAQPLADMWQVNPGVYRIRLSIPMGQPGAASDSIRDDQVSYQSSWSSEYTQAQIAALLDDEVTAAGTGWSSQKIADAIEAARVTELAWSAIKGKPATFTPAAHSHAWDQITGKPSTFPPAGHSHSWGEITGKPSAFVPVSHKHSATDITAGVVSEERLPVASTSGPGIVQLATAAEVEAGASTTAVPSVADVASYVTAQLADAIPTVTFGRFVGAEWDGKTPLKRQYLHSVIQLSTANTGNGSVGISNTFPNGIVYANVVMNSSALIPMIRHEGGSPGSTLDKIEMHFKTPDGKNATGLVRLTLEIVGW